MLKMDKLDLIFEEMVFSRNKNLYVIYTATMKHLKIGEKSDVIAVSMATLKFQYGGYLNPIYPFSTFLQTVCSHLKGNYFKIFRRLFIQLFSKNTFYIDSFYLMYINHKIILVY